MSLQKKILLKWSKLSIYCFSGTGNSLTAASWILDQFAESNIESEIILVDRLKNAEFLHQSPNQLTGFHYPTHGFNLPWHMLKFIWRFPKATQNSKYFYLLNTRAGAKVYKLFTPGISGIAIFLPLLILKCKGYKVAGILPLDPPSNWISLHPGFRKKVVNSIMERCERITSNFSTKLLNGKRVIHPATYLALPIDIALIPISILYLLIGRFFLAKTFFASSTCNSCGICEKHCPVGAIQMRGSRPYWKFRCESCMRCMNICPQKSINTIHLYAVGILWFIFGLPISDFSTTWIVNISPAILEKFEGLIHLSVLTLYSLPTLWVSYHIIHFFGRFKYFNGILTYTSLTKYWLRYIAPGIKAKSFANRNFK
jgi:Pyruvate/2-oxoacid:ferredoxin oxidoreductase delta subunit